MLLYIYKLFSYITKNFNNINNYNFYICYIYEMNNEIIRIVYRVNVT